MSDAVKRNQPAPDGPIYQMYQFSDYFDIGKRRQPYSVPGEELEDYLRLLDMMLESYFEFKGTGSKGKLFSRGLVVTESEMLSYFDMPPYFRERDIWNPVLAAAADEAFSYINGRTEATKKDGGSPDLYRLGNLSGIFDLDRTEIIAVLLALSAEIDRRYERIYGFLQDDITKGTPTLGLLNALMGRISVRDGSEETVPMPLKDRMYRYFLLRGEEPQRLSDPLILHPLMKQILTGAPDRRDYRFSPFHPFEEESGIPVFFEDSLREISAAEEKKSDENIHSVYLANDDEETVLHLLSCYCSGQNDKLYVLDLQQLRNMQTDKRRMCLSELYIRLKLFGGRLAVRFDPENDSGNPQNQNAELRNYLEDFRQACEPKPFYLFGQKEEPGELAALFVPFIRIPDTPVALRTKIWEYFLTSDKKVRISGDVNIPDLADCYEIPYGKVKKVIGHAVATAGIRPEMLIDRNLILGSLRQMNQVDFSGLAVYVNPAYTWDDITITDAQKALMKTACDRYRLRNRVGEAWDLKRKNAYGNGVSILLYGPPGTGKTMAAQVIANELSLPLYRVDISQISSKYIGETEKNLAVIFNAAAKANVILFFDEADALFSKRTSVGDSHDKYANSETAFLLQKIEEYDGMSILSTNYYNNFDDAFVRRITYSVHLQQPDKETRYTLWTSILPAKAEIDESVDFRFLADKFELSGSNIKAILFNAAYMAGAEQEAVGMKHIVRSLEYEFDKLGKLVNSSDFGKYDKYLQSAGEKKEQPKPEIKPGVKK